MVAAVRPEEPMVVVAAAGPSQAALGPRPEEAAAEEAEEAEA
jgi:hypothetical protein